MSAGEPSGPRLTPDAPGRRLLWGLLVSLPVNLIVWGLASRVVHRPAPTPPAPFIVQRIILAPPKVIPKSPLKKTVRKAPRPKMLPPPKSTPPKPPVVVPPRPFPRRAAPPTPSPTRQVVPRIATRPQHILQPPSHPRLLTAQGATPAINTVPPNGAAPPGTPMESPVQAAPVPVPPTPVHSSEAAPPPRNVSPAPSAAPSPPAHQDAPPSPVGPTREAQPLFQVNPEIPDELREEGYQSSLRVSVQIDAEGKITNVTLLGTSGSRELDRRVVDALKRWRWQPALRDGKPVPATRIIPYSFEVP